MREQEKDNLQSSFVNATNRSGYGLAKNYGCDFNLKCKNCNEGASKSILKLSKSIRISD